jgi:hypothetical protein
MSRQDRDLEADAEASIAEHAGYSGLEFNQGGWSYQQLVCLAFPNHLFLRFTRDQGAGDVSVFSAAIPRNGEGRVRIIPILRRSYSLFSPAPINALTIAAFNRIRAEEGSVQPDGWLGVGLCYAALAGANAQIPQPDEWNGNPKSYPATSASLSFPAKGGAVLRLTDDSARPRPLEWTLVFDGKGKLLKAARRPAAQLSVKETRPGTVQQKGAQAASGFPQQP